MSSKTKDSSVSGDDSNPGKIFVGGLPKDTSYATFIKHFNKYGEITDSVIMRDRVTGQPRGFGFVTFADPSVVDVVIEEPHVINGKQIEIKRTIPKGSSQPKEMKTRKIFVGGIPFSVTEDDFKEFFSKHGKVVEHQIIRDHESKRSRGFGFIVFNSEEEVDELISKGNMIDMAGSQVEIKKAEPRKPLNSFLGSSSRSRFNNDSFVGFHDPYFGLNRGYGSGPLRMSRPMIDRFSGGYSYGDDREFGYRSYGSLEGYNERGFGFPDQFGPYSSRFDNGPRGYTYGSFEGYGGHEHGDFGGYGPLYGRGSIRYHPYER